MSQISKNKIGQDFSVFGLFKFCLPAFLMNIFTQIFRSIDDALFISKYVGEKALAAINLINPLTCIHLAISHLFSLGSANISARLMGENKQDEAKRVFTRIVISTFVTGLLFALIINIFAKEILTMLGVDDELYKYAIYQIRIVFLITPISLINSVFTNYYSTSGKPSMGMICSIINGATNIILDIILVAKLNMGVLGTSIATSGGELIVFIIGLLFFLNPNNEITFVKPQNNFIKTSLESFKYALPQFVNSLSISVTNLVTNNILLKQMGSSGIAANAVVTDIRSIITSGLVGIGVSIGPIIAYNYGNKNIKRLKKTFYNTLKIWLITSLSLMAIGIFFRKPFINIYLSNNSSKQFYETAMLGLLIETFSVPFTSACIITSRFFIALKNTKASTIISTFRNLVFKMIVLLTLPYIFNKIGVFLAIPVGEFISFILCAFLLIKNADNYGYGKNNIAKYLN